MKTQAMHKVVKARAGLILDQPFFGSLALRMDLKEDSTCKTFWTDGKEIGYNPVYVDTLPLEQVKGILAHEVLHIANEHHLRRAKREQKRWNTATDKAINGILHDANFALPQEAIYPDEKGKSAEWYYSKDSEQEQEQEQNEQGGQGQGESDGQGQERSDIGEVRDLPGEQGKQASEQEIKQASADNKVNVAQAEKSAKAFGKMSNGLKRVVDDILEPIVDWKEVLRRFVDERARNDYTWKRANPRYMTQGLYLPALYNEEMKSLVVVIDTSGSIDVDMLNQFASEIDSIMRQYQTSIDVLYVDSQLQGSEHFDAQDNVRLSPVGGGGTSFVPAFDEIEKRGLTPSCVIYLTDGECDSFTEDSSVPVIWVLTSKNEYFAPPYGETTYMQK